MTYAQQIRVTINFEQIFDDEKVFSLTDLHDQLRLFDPFSVNIILSKFSLFEAHQIGKTTANHVVVLSSLLDKKHTQKLLETVNNSQGSKQVIFNDFAIMALFKLNNEVKRDGGYKIDNPEDRLQFARILLAVNSIIFEYKPAHDADKLKEYIRYEQAKQFLSKGDGAAINLITRIDYLREFLNEDYPIIDELFVKATGLNMQTYYQLIFCLLPGWSVNHEPEKLDHVVMRDYLKYFSGIKFEDSIIEKFIESLSTTRSNFIQLNSKYVAKAKNVDSIWNYITFLNRPILIENNVMLCASPSLLNLAMVEGIYNVVRSYIDDNHVKGVDLPNIWGVTYEKYILTILKNAFGDALAINITINEQASIDAVVELNNTVLLIEIKYAHWRYTTRTDPSVENIRHHLGKINRYKPWIDERNKKKTNKKGFGQIKDFYVRYKNGELEKRFNFADKQIIPVLILGEMFPFDPINRELFEDYLKEEDCLMEYEEAVLPSVLLSTSEIELLEGLIENVSLNKFIELFRKFSYSFREKRPYFERSTTFHNTVHEAGYRSFNNSKRMRKRLDLATDSIHVFFDTTE
jgi:hypothetical protein